MEKRPLRSAIKKANTARDDTRHTAERPTKESKKKGVKWDGVSLPKVPKNLPQFAHEYDPDHSSPEISGEDSQTGSPQNIELGPEEEATRQVTEETSDASGGVHTGHEGTENVSIQQEQDVPALSMPVLANVGTPPTSPPNVAITPSSSPNVFAPPGPSQTPIPDEEHEISHYEEVVQTSQTMGETVDDDPDERTFYCTNADGSQFASAIICCGISLKNNKRTNEHLKTAHNIENTALRPDIPPLWAENEIGMSQQDILRIGIEMANVNILWERWGRAHYLTEDDRGARLEHLSTQWAMKQLQRIMAPECCRICGVICREGASRTLHELVHVSDPKYFLYDLPEVAPNILPFTDHSVAVLVRLSGIFRAKTLEEQLEKQEKKWKAEDEHRKKTRKKLQAMIELKRLGNG